jgi:hypothetical protein
MENQKLQSVRNLNPRLYKRLRAFALQENISVGTALNIAIESLLNQKSKQKKDPRKLLQITPFDWGKGTENTSTEVDTIIYR